MLNRRRVVEEVLRDRGDTLLVTGLGGTTWDAAAFGDHPNNFYLWGAMGGAAMVGLGLAIAQPERRVLVITGDGEMLMGMGSLATIGVQRPSNLAIVVIDNQRFGETGMQKTHTALGVDLVAAARASGFPSCHTVGNDKELEVVIPLLHGGIGPVFAVFQVSSASEPMVLPEKDGAVLAKRFRNDVLRR